MIRVLVVDDSALMRKLLGQVFAEAGDFVVETARDGVEALAKLPVFQPQVVTLDVQMPVMDGLTCLNRIMVEHPCPVVMVSSLTAQGAEETLSALELGAIDFVAKPAGAISLNLESFAPVLLEKVRAASSVGIKKSRRLTERLRYRSGLEGEVLQRAPPTWSAAVRGLVLIGCSTGGPPALDQVLSSLPADFPLPIAIAQHMPASFTGALARRLDQLCDLSVSEVGKATLLEAGSAYIARGDADLILSRRGAQLMAMPVPVNSEHRWHPSVDRLVDSAIEQIAPRQLIGILMTGMGDDGAASMTRLRNGGGMTIAEARDSAVVWGMPGALVAQGGASETVTLDRIADRLLALVS